MTPEKSQGWHITVTHPFGDHTPLCLTWAFESQCSCSAPLSSNVGCIRGPLKPDFPQFHFCAQKGRGMGRGGGGGAICVWRLSCANEIIIIFESV